MSSLQVIEKSILVCNPSFFRIKWADYWRNRITNSQWVDRTALIRSVGDAPDSERKFCMIARPKIGKKVRCYSLTRHAKYIFKNPANPTVILFSWWYWFPAHKPSRHPYVITSTTTCMTNLYSFSYAVLGSTIRSLKYIVSLFLKPRLDVRPTLNNSPPCSLVLEELRAIFFELQPIQHSLLKIITVQ